MASDGPPGTESLQSDLGPERIDRLKGYMIQTGVLLSKPNDDKSMGSQQMAKTHAGLPRTRDGRQTAHDVRHVSRQPPLKAWIPAGPSPPGVNMMSSQRQRLAPPRRGWQKGVPDFLEFGNCV